MGKVYLADSYKTNTGDDIVLTKQNVIIANDVYGNVKDNIQTWKFDTSDRLHIAVIGDSISMGAWADTAPINWASKGFCGMIQKALRRSMGNGGMGFIGMYDTSYWSRSGTWGQNTDFGPFGYCFYSSTNSSVATLSNIVGDNAEIYYINNSAVTFSYSIDGGGYVTVNSSGTYDNHVAKVAISLGSVGGHTIDIKGATSGTLFLHGISIYTGSSGVVLHKIAFSGEMASNSVIRFTDRFSGMIQHFTPKLTFLNFLANDFVYQDSAINSITNYQTNMNTIASAIKSLNSDLIIWQPPKGTKLPNANTYTLKQYEDASKSAAIANNAAWVDFHADWGDSNLDKMYDDQHPNEKGHKYIASQFLRLIRLFS